MEETLDKNFSDNSNLQLTPDARADLFGAYRWMRFMAITGFVVLGLSVLGALFSLRGIRGNDFEGLILFLGMLLFVFLGFLPAYFGYRASTTGMNAIESMDKDELEVSIRYFYRLMTFYGILLIITISIYALILLFALVKVF